MRAYQFQRINRSGLNQQATNFGGGVHAEYTFNARPLTLGATYYFADPLGQNGSRPQTNPKIDNSLPGFSYSSLGELYVEFRSWRDFAQVGKMQLATPWAGSADARLIPVTYQGLTARHYFGRGWDFGLTRVARFKSRTSSTFDANDLLTQATTPGFLLLDLTHTAGAFSGSLHQYWFYDVAAMTYAQVRVQISERTFVAAQMVAEADIGKSLVGTIHNHTIGLQAGTKIGALDATLGYNSSPGVLYRTAAPKTIFQPAGGTPAVRSLGNGIFAVAGGGIASPYSDAYTADPLFTTSFVASLVDRRSTGSAFRFQLAGTTANGRFSGILARGFYDYSNALGPATATESEFDGTYFLSNIDPTRVYTGFSIRQRWGYRTSTGPPFDFLYSRTQLQYNF